MVKVGQKQKDRIWMRTVKVRLKFSDYDTFSLFCQGLKIEVLNPIIVKAAVTEEFPIPDQLVGLVIGRGGENIQRIQQATNVC